MSAWLEMADDMLGTCVDTFEHVVTISPLKSIGFGAASYQARGVYSERPVDVQTEDGAILSTTTRTLGVRLSEFTTTPVAGDQVMIAGATYVIDDADDDGQGGTVWTIKELRP